MKKIFKGLVASLKTTNIGGVYYIEVEGISGSFQLDIQKKSRSFQDINMEYPKLIKEIIKTYPGHDFINSIGDGVKIESPIFQYNETDWELIKRLASNFNSVIACDIMEKSPRLYFGFPSGKSYVLPDDIPYSASKDLSAFMKAGGYDAGFHDTDFFYYEIESGDNYALGDEIEFRQKKIYVSQITAYIDKGLLKYKYRLSRIKGIRQNTIYNEKLKGVSLEGKVIECKGELVKLHLKIDTEQEKSKACWFPFAPPTGNIMYCLPKVGTDASLYFSDDTGNNAKVLGCLRKNGGSCTKTGNTNNRYFGTEHGSELEITPSAINIVSGCTEPLKISFDDDTGVTITSHKKLTLNADQEISFLTPKRIIIKAQSQIFMKRTNMATGLSIENNHNFLGNDFIADGSDRSIYSPFNDEPTVATDEQVKKAEEEKEDEDGFNWGKLIGNVVAALVVVAVVAVVAVLVVATGGAALAAVGVIAASSVSTAATVAGVGALVVGTAAVANLAASDIQRGEVSDIDTYIGTGAKKACMGAVFGAMFGPVGIVVETVLSIGSISDEIDNAMLNIDNTFDAFNKEFGIDNPIIRRAEGLVGGTGKFVWGFVKSTEFIGETFYDMGAFGVATIGNELGLVSDEETDELRDKFNVDKDTWKQVPEAIGNSINNVVVNAPRFLFDPNMTEKEASDFVNDALMTAVIVKGTVDVTKAVAGKVPDVINKANEALTPKEVLGPKEVFATENGQRITIGKEPMEPGGGNKVELNQQQKDYWKAIEEGKKREIADEGVSNPETVKYYRVQGGTPPNASRTRINIGDEGKISIPNKNSNLNISTGDLEHANHFKNLRGEGAEIVEFEVPNWFDDFVKESALPQKGYKKNPLNQGKTVPKIVDPTTPGTSYEFPSPWVEWIEEYGTNGKITK